MILPLILRLFGYSKKINISLDEITIKNYRDDITQIAANDFIGFPSQNTSLIGSIISLPLSSGVVRYKVISSQNIDGDLTKLCNVLSENISLSVKDLKDAFGKAAIECYLRDSEIKVLDEKIGHMLNLYHASKEEWLQHLDKDIINIVDNLTVFFPLSRNKELVRENYERKMLLDKHDFLSRIESHPLTQEQSLAVIRNNDRNLVLAAAGAGKTSVMVAKALDLINSSECDAGSVLVLAYNKAAAEELKVRVHHCSEKIGLAGDKTPDIQTFHALGRNILKETGYDTYLSELAEDELKLKQWVTNWLLQYASSGKGRLQRLITLASTPKNPLDFETKEEYEAYTQIEKRTLNGELVKGYQELIIANWLYTHGIAYEYEAPYLTKRRLEAGIDYRPDFHLKDTKIYLEHFGIDRQGNTRRDINKEEYNFSITKKRRLHQECGTTLLETFHYDWTEGKLEQRLEALMKGQGIALNPIADDEILKGLTESGFIDEQSTRYLKCLQAIRTERLDRNGVLRRIKTKKIAMAEEYSELLDELLQAYLQKLELEKRIDFDDMILKATACVQSGKFKPKWSHILVDEFQDISMARMELLNALIDKGPKPMFTAVGDDWQSIYRFSGGKLELTTQFESRVGSHSLTKLEKTFRYNNSIADTAGNFVMKNPEQYRKHVMTHTQVSEPQIYLLDSLVNGEDFCYQKVCRIIETIQKNDPKGSIAVLGRYRYLLDKAKSSLKVVRLDKEINFWTFHASKGLEADYCILIGLNQEKLGFPSEIQDEELLGSLLPALDNFPFSEERRLMYVALTRAKKKCYLISDSSRPSEFVRELLSPDYHLNIGSEGFQYLNHQNLKCPGCSTGFLKLLKGEYGNYYRCSHVGCSVQPRVCIKCGSPSIDTSKWSVCVNAECRYELPLCEKCGRPLKIREDKKGVKFWGCSGFGIPNDSCDFTMPIVNESVTRNLNEKAL